MIRKNLLLTASVGAIAVSGAFAANAQTGALKTDAITKSGKERTTSETAELYTSTISYLMETIEKDIRNDAGLAVITALRSGQISQLPSMDATTLGLIEALGIRAVVVDADPAPDVQDERIVVYVSDENMRQNISRSDIEAEAKRNEYNGIMRIQNGRVIGPEGEFELPDNMPGGVPTAAVGAFMGISGNDKVTSGGNGSVEVRTLACEAGYYGTGRVFEYEISRTTDLGGTTTDITEADADRRLISENCSPEYVQPTRYFDICTADDGSAGQALYEADQYVRQSASNPFETEVWIDKANRTGPIGESECLTGDRISDAQDFLVTGGGTAPRELDLKTAADASDIGSGPNTVPADLSGKAEYTIPFLPNSESEFQYTRSCAAEYGSVTIPGGFRGADVFIGDTNYFRDYNRRETYFSDNPAEYILNYDLVRDPNPYGHPSKGRGTIDTAYGSAPSGDGWYKGFENCERELTHDEREDRTLACASGYPSHPNGSYSQGRDGEGFYTQRPGGSPSLDTIVWQPWYETGNSCYYTDVERTTESRTVPTTSGGQDCDQPQTRTRVVTTDYFYSGGSNSSTNYDPNWTNNGGPTNCVAPPPPPTSGGGGGGQSADASCGCSDSGDGPGTPGYGGGTTGASSGNSGGGGGGDGGGCFAPDTPVTMADGTTKPICEVEIGDEIAEGGIVLVLGDFYVNDVYHLEGVRVTASHVVKNDKGWTRVKDDPRAIAELPRWQRTCNLITSNNRMICGGILFADQTEFGGVFLEDMMAMDEGKRLDEMNAETVQRQVA
ncbi:hypothetical protein LCGC14_0112850 [marine sediment metagenome]|uniref:Uncharacterized protein n=1 Tax=marine sediment metagenome TaxID=412755 RepID=A0A0F9VD24_9ZZZZ